MKGDSPVEAVVLVATVTMFPRFPLAVEAELVAPCRLREEGTTMDALPGCVGVTGTELPPLVLYVELAPRIIGTATERCTIACPLDVCPDPDTRMTCPK